MHSDCSVRVLPDFLSEDSNSVVNNGFSLAGCFDVITASGPTPDAIP